MRHLYAILADKGLPGKTDEFKKLVVRTFIRVPRTIFFTRAIVHLMRGIYYSWRKKIPQKQQEFLIGSSIWGEKTQKMTDTEIKLLNEIEVPEKGHFIFLNHVNEMDFAFDCLLLKKPFLANQEIKNTYVAYWWMKAMGSEVFDRSDKRTIARSVKNLLKGLKAQSYIVYPEGRNTYSEEVKPLKKGMINLSFKLKIPILVVVKSGMTAFQVQPKKNVLAYKSCGIVDPRSFASWEELREHIRQLMQDEKKKMDEQFVSE